MGLIDIIKSLNQMNFKEPYLLVLIVIGTILLFYFMFNQLIKFNSKKQSKEYSEFTKNIKYLRWYVLLSRIIIVSLIVLALASPFIETRTTIAGDKQVKILIDESESFELFNSGLGDKLEQNLKGKFPVTKRVIASDKESMLGDNILSSIGTGENLFIISDGNVNKGRRLSDLVLYSLSVNSTINAINLEKEMRDESDSSIVILGPKKTVSNVDNTYYVKISNPNKITNQIIVTVDGTEILNKNTEEELIPITKTFLEGEHEIVAKINNKDYFSNNNIYYKIVEVLPQPNILFVSEESSPLDSIFEELYDVTNSATLPSSLNELNKYSSIILNDINNVDFSQSETLAEYIVNGGGLVVIGGSNSYDFGDYEGTFFETLLPVRIGLGDKIEGDTNIVIVIDISGSTSSNFGGNSVVDVEKAQAISILENMKSTDKVALVAFNSQAFRLTELEHLGENKQVMINQISRLKDGGGTVIAEGLREAIDILDTTVGSKQIVLISDGITQLSGNSILYSKLAASKGIRIYTVGIGDKTDEAHMKSIASNGLGNYFKPDESQKLRILFDRNNREGSDIDEGFRLGISDNNHFISSGLELDAKVTGFNQVVPKSSAQIPITTSDGDPIITVWRFGLGRVAAITTDDGSNYAGELLSSKNSQVISRTVNWGVGDLSRSLKTYVDIKDTNIDKSVDIIIKSPSKPGNEGFVFEKRNENLYTTTYFPKESEGTGFKQILGKKVAVNYNSEYEKVGFNEELRELVIKSGGLMVDIDDRETLNNLIEQRSPRTKVAKVSLKWFFALIALILFIIEVGIRRVVENKLQK